MSAPPPTDPWWRQPALTPTFHTGVAGRYWRLRCLGRCGATTASLDQTPHPYWCTRCRGVVERIADGDPDLAGMMRRLAS